MNIGIFKIKDQWIIWDYDSNSILANSQSASEIADILVDIDEAEYKGEKLPEKELKNQLVDYNQFFTYKGSASVPAGLKRIGV